MRQSNSRRSLQQPIKTLFGQKLRPEFTIRERRQFRRRLSQAQIDDLCDRCARLQSRRRTTSDRKLQHVLHRDIETRSRARLDLVGTWRYAADPTTEVLCVGYAVDDAPVQIWTPDQPVPEEFIEAARRPDWLVAAHNDQFESAIEQRLLRPRYGWPLVRLERHRCTLAMARAAGLPGALENAALALGLPYQKDREGQRLMRRLSRLSGKDPDLAIEGPRLHRYCAQDVEVARALYYRLPAGCIDCDHRQRQLFDQH